MMLSDYNFREDAALQLMRSKLLFRIQPVAGAFGRKRPSTRARQHALHLQSLRATEM